MLKPFADKSCFSGASKSTRPDLIKQAKSQIEIDLDDFADFNEESLIDSAQSGDSNNCEFFYPQ